MTKKERIAILENEVAQLKVQMANVLQRLDVQIPSVFISRPITSPNTKLSVEDARKLISQNWIANTHAE